MLQSVAVLSCDRFETGPGEKQARCRKEFLRIGSETKQETSIDYGRKRNVIKKVTK